jgi:hypothetical protein
LDTVITERADLTTKTTAELVAQNQASLNLKVSNLIATIGCYYSSGKFGVEASKSGISIIRNKAGNRMKPSTIQRQVLGHR